MVLSAALLQLVLDLLVLQLQPVGQRLQLLHNRQDRQMDRIQKLLVLITYLRVLCFRIRLLQECIQEIIILKNVLA